MPVGVDDGGGAAFCPPGKSGAVIQMDVSVDKVPGSISVQQVHKALEATVREVLQVVDMPGGGVGEKDIEALVAPELEAQTGDPPPHLGLGIHVLSGAVAVGAAQTQNPQAMADHDLILCAEAALWGGVLQPVVMVAPDIDHRAAGQSA